MITTYVPGILYAKAKGRWQQSPNTRFATEAEAEAYLAWLRSRHDDVVETRITPSDYGPTHVWNFEHDTIVEQRRRSDFHFPYRRRKRK